MSKKLLWIVVFLVLTLTYFRLFLPGPIASTDFPYVSQDAVEKNFNIPQLWSPISTNFGSYSVSTSWSWPIDLVYSSGAKLGISFTVLEKLIGVLPIVLLAIWGIIRLLKKLGLSSWGLAVGVVFFSINTYILLIIDGGQLSIGLAYAWFPSAYLFLKNAIHGTNKTKLLSGVSVSILGFLDIRFVYIFLIFVFFDFLFELIFNYRNWLNIIFEWIKTGLMVSLVFVFLHAFWIIPTFLSKTPALPVSYQRVSQTTFLSFAKLSNAILLLQPHWYKNIFGKIDPINRMFLLIPVIAFLAPITLLTSKKKLKEIIFWLFIAFLGMILVKGNNFPIPEIYPWLFTHVPGFNLFRDPTKFYIFIALSYSVLISITIDWLTTIKFKLPNKKLNISYSKLKIIPVIFILYLLFLVRPVYLGQMTGMFSKPYNLEEFIKSFEFIRNDTNYSRVLWIPVATPVNFSSILHPVVSGTGLINTRPFEIGIVGMYETMNFLREAPFIGQLLDIADIKYLVYPYPDTRREELKQDNIDYYYSFLDQLTNLPWVKGRLSNPPVPVLETKKSEDHFFVAPNTFYVVGSDRIYWDFQNIANFDLAKNALVFAEETPTVIKNPDNLPVPNIILYDKSETDLAASLADKSNFIFPGSNLRFDPTKNDPWWKRETSDFLWWRNFLQQKYKIDNLDFDYGGGWAIAEGDQKLQIANNNLQTGKILLARVMKSSRGGKVSFVQSDKLIGEIDTKKVNPEKVEIQLTGYKNIPDQFFDYDKADFNWNIVGKLITDGNLSIKTEGDINVVNAILALNETEWNRLNRMTNPNNIFVWGKLSQNDKEKIFSQYQSDIDVTYRTISPTEYKVTISGINNPVSLAFSESYDGMWQANGVGSFPLYSLINGFRIDKDGEYDIYYSPQRYVIYGLIISLISLGLILATLVILHKRKPPVEV